MDRSLLPQKIKKVDRNIRGIFDKFFDKYGLTRSQSIALRFIGENQENGVTQKNLESFFNISKSTVSGIVDRLENGGFIKRVKDKNDSRVNLLVIQEKAEKLNDDVIKTREKLDLMATANISEEEYELLLSLLDRVTMNLEKLKEESKNV